MIIFLFLYYIMWSRVIRVIVCKQACATVAPALLSNQVKANILLLLHGTLYIILMDAVITHDDEDPAAKF